MVKLSLERKNPFFGMIYAAASAALKSADQLSLILVTIFGLKIFVRKQNSLAEKSAIKHMYYKWNDFLNYGYPKYNFCFLIY